MGTWSLTVQILFQNKSKPNLYTPNVYYNLSFWLDNRFSFFLVELKLMFDLFIFSIVFSWYMLPLFVLLKLDLSCIIVDHLPYYSECCIYSLKPLQDGLLHVIKLALVGSRFLYFVFWCLIFFVFTIVCHSQLPIRVFR